MFFEYCKNANISFIKRSDLQSSEVQIASFGPRSMRRNEQCKMLKAREDQLRLRFNDLLGPLQISAKRGPDSRFVIEAKTKSR